MFRKLVNRIVGDPNQKIIENLKPTVDAVAALEPQMQQLSVDGLRAKTAELKDRHAAGESLDDLLVEAFALVREASVRTTGLRHYDVQIMGGVLLHRGEVVEMRTGEGKTLVGTLPLFLNALTGQGVHLVTVNEYLARRDGGWMGKIFHLLGLNVGCIGPQKFSALYDPDYVNPGAELEDERLVHWRPSTRKQAYLADITYGISSEFGFDYLRDNMTTSRDKLVQRDLVFAIIDEVDNVLIDEARTPLIISGPADRSGKEYSRFSDYVRHLKKNTAEEEEEPNGHYDLDEKSRSISLTDMGIAEVEKRIPEIDTEVGDSLYDPRFFHLTYYLDNALKAQYLYKKDVQYVVQNGEVVIVDDFTGRLMPGRRYSEGLHEAIEAKEGVQIKRETVTVATITLQNYFRLFDKLGGMTGTALTDAEEFDKIYELGVTPLPTNVQYIVDNNLLGLEEKKVKVENSEQTVYLDPETGDPRFYKRLDHPDQIFGNEEAKDKAIVREVQRVVEMGRPVLVGTTSVEHSETIDRLLTKANIPHKVLNAKIHQSEALVVAQAGRKSAVTISTNMAGRGTDILLGGNPEGLAAELLEREMFKRPLLTQLIFKYLEEGETAAQEYAGRNSKLDNDLIAWIVSEKEKLDAALTEIEEVQVMGYLTRVLGETYQLDYEEIRQALRLITSGNLGEAREYLEQLNKDVALVEEAIRLRDLYVGYQRAQSDQGMLAQFLAEILFEQHYIARAALVRAILNDEAAEAEKVVETVPGISRKWIKKIADLRHETEAEREEVWRLGGLHVVGSERHESRRIDNQLRGRAARQGDPGSSRFFLSLEDDLMRRFGGERLKSWMSKGLMSNIPEDMPLEFGVLDRMIESAQERVEGYNFDIRKNIVEYDDVMNRQRMAIYKERRAILMGEGVDYDERIDDAFANAIAQLVDNYIDNYIPFLREEIERVVTEFTTEATDVINLNAVVARLRGFLPEIVKLDKAELGQLSSDELIDHLMVMVHENEANGANIYQLLRAMGRFLPLLPPVPNLASLASRKSGQVQGKENIRRDYVARVQDFYNEFVTDHVELADEDREGIWQDAENDLNDAFAHFSLDGLSLKTAEYRQTRFAAQANAALREMLLDTLSVLTGDQLEIALKAYVSKQQEKWRQQIGDEEYRNFQRLLLLNSIDREWRDYLTAADDLRREIGLEAVGQRDPKVQYKIRSAQMFQDMRNNIEQNIVDRFFFQVEKHRAFIQKQEAEIAYQTQARDAGYQVVKREKGQGVELRRDMPKVGRNDPCPCGSGKKYKHCHLKKEKASQNSGAVGRANGRPAGSRSGKKRRRRR
ncbi:preprotein translocase subunit SecA [Candidatus Leptofilum sp.]|uniref:preprotein translocase subunit SecA n=1 Tax=Candidatus Leptofilum sp. TaxID=3241576 RepID=UPI003B5C7BAC